MLNNELSYEKYLDTFYFYTTQEVLDTYGPNYRKFLAKSLVMKDYEKFLEYKERDLIEFKTQNGVIKISANLIKDMITQMGLYSYLVDNYTSYTKDNILAPERIKALTIRYISDDVNEVIEYNRADIAYILKNLPDELEQEIGYLPRVQLILGLSTYNSYKKRCNINSLFDVVIDGNKYSVKLGDIFELLEMDDQHFIRVLKGEISYEYEPKYMMYILKDFVERSRILSKYVLDSNVVNRITKICSYEIVDFETLNKNNKTNDENPDGTSIVDDVQMNPGLYELIFDGVNKSYAPIELAVYTYIKMCEYLNISKKTNNQDLYEITPANNLVNIYEFTLLYLSILKKLDLKYTVDQQLFDSATNAGKITLRASEYLVELDIDYDKLASDFNCAKNGEKVNNIKSVNNNAVSNQKFNELIYFITKDNLLEVQMNLLFNKNLEEYNQKYQDSNISIKNRITIFVKEIFITDLSGIYSIEYIKTIYDLIIGKNSYVNMEILSNKTDNIIVVLSIRLVDDIKYLVINQFTKQAILVDELEYKNNYLNNCEKIEHKGDELNHVRKNT